jgi:hypothetical protein
MDEYICSNAWIFITCVHQTLQADEPIRDLNDKQALDKEEIFDFIMSPNRDDSDLYLRYSALCLKILLV